MFHCTHDSGMANPILQRLMGASLLVFKNKSDVPGSMTEGEVRQVSGLKDFSVFDAGVSANDISYRGFNWTRSRRTNGPSWPAVP